MIKRFGKTSLTYLLRIWIELLYLKMNGEFNAMIMILIKNFIVFVISKAIKSKRQYMEKRCLRTYLN